MQELISDLEREEHHKLPHLHKPTVAAPPEIHTLPMSLSYTRPSIAECKVPFIVLAVFSFQSGQTGTALTGFKEFTDWCEQNEPGTLSYTTLEDKAANQLRTIEVYERKEFMYNVHLRSEAMKKNGEQNGHLRVSDELSSVKCQKVVGWLYRD